MNPKEWEHTKEIFLHAAGLSDSAEQRKYLEAICGADASLRAQVEALLATRNQSNNMLSRFDSLPGTTLGHYQVIEKIEEGSTGAVYRARDTQLGRFVAVKVLPPQLLADSNSIRRFRQEARCLSTLSHPHIVTLFNIEEEKGALFLVMEYVSGKTLAACLQAGGLPVVTAVQYGRQIAEAMAAAHAQGIIHRDLKPSNILVTTDSTIKVVDFGLAKITDRSVESTKSDHTPHGTILGTADYMSPEQARGDAVDGRSDIFSFGIVFYEMLTGKHIFHRESVVETMAAILKDPAPSPDRPFPESVFQILDRCLAKDPAQRYQTADELGRALEAADGALRLLDARRRPVRRLQKRWLAAIASMACLLPFIGWSAYRTLGGVSAQLVSAAEQTVTPAARFDRAIAAHRKANATGCFKHTTAPCDLKGAIAELKAAIADWDALLRARPHHAGALWNAALAEESLCELLSRTQEWAPARAAGEEAIAHFGEALAPGSSYDDLPGRLPEEADVLWNRGLTHAMRARLPDLGTEGKRKEFSHAIADLDRVLNGSTRYAAFLQNNRFKIVRLRAAIERERDTLPAQAAR